MFKKFPLFYIAWLYIFSTKDKIVFFMQQFASLVIALCIAVLICTFSIMNGFNNQIQTMVTEKSAPIVLVAPDSKELKDTILNFNLGFTKPIIHLSQIKSIDYKRGQISLVFIDFWQKQMIVYEDPNQIEPIATNTNTKNNLFSGQLNKIVRINDPNSYNPLIGGLTRFKQYNDISINDTVTDLKNEDSILILSSKEYKKLFRNENYNIINIYLNNFDDTELVFDYLKKQTVNIDNLKIKTWQEANPYLLNTLEVQKKIFMLVYFIMFVLLCAIIVSTNIAFFKEKRKDWALLKILHIKPFSVERIFLYKNIILFLLSTTCGVIFGTLVTIYSNHIIDFLTIITHSKINNIFITQKITYLFNINDFIKIVLFSFGIFFINFIILVTVFRNEDVANFLKTQ